MTNEELMHYGIKGQKWGIRRFQNKDGSLTNAGKKHSEAMSKAKSDRAARKAEAKSRKQAKKDMKKAVKNRQTLSDAELDARINRIQKEKKLKELTQEELNPGRKAAKEVLASSGKKAAGIIVAGAMVYGVKVAMTKNFDLEEAVNYMTQKPKFK